MQKFYIKYREREKIFQIQAESEQDAIIIAKQLITSKYLLRLLEDESIPKIGLSLHDDIISLHKRAEFKPGNFIDLQKHVGEIGVEDLSLQKLYANFFGLKISKAQRLTNWEADILTDKQKVYAATDAWACIKLYDELMRLERNKDFELRIVKPAEETVEAMAKKQA